MTRTHPPHRQPLVLIIDPDATARSLARELVQARFGGTVLETPDPIVGLDLAAEHRAALDLVVLDVHLPRLSGFDLCLRLREILSARQAAVPILPFTAPGGLKLLAELGCAPPCSKPASPEQLAAAIQWALVWPVPPLPATPLLQHARQRAAAAEQAARQRYLGSLALLASALPARLSLQQLLASAGGLLAVEAPAAVVLDALLEQRPVQLLAADAGDRRDATGLALRHRLPLLLIATSREDARALTVDVPLLSQAQGMVDATGEQAPAVIAAALAALIRGERFVHLPAVHTPAAPEPVVPTMIVGLLRAAQLTPRERELLWLDLQGWETAQIAERLHVTPTTVFSYWKRIQRKLGRDRAAIRAWVREQVRGSDPPPGDERSVGG